MLGTISEVFSWGAPFIIVIYTPMNIPIAARIRTERTIKKPFKKPLFFFFFFFSFEFFGLGDAFPLEELCSECEEPRPEDETLLLFLSAATGPEGCDLPE
ncbi:hypothetical protein SDC9_103151 [bioreactor metagenome]|uniref:Uncharacterized protein n=1 Tax=bioreactor metagenome TaxID=1076179 RepID=A0A645ATE2_9ZZZZ